MCEVSFAIIKLVIIALFGYLLYRRSIITDEVLRFLTSFIINFSLPFLMFTNLINQSDKVKQYPLWIFIVISAGIFLGGYCLGLVVVFWRRQALWKEFIGLVSFQNSGYLPMNIALFLFPPALREVFLVYLFLYLLGFNVIMWSIGSFFIFKKRKDAFELKRLFTPPITGTLLALAFIYTNTTRVIPALLVDSLAMIGEMSFVLSMIVLGCWLARLRLTGFMNQFISLSAVILLKLVALPLFAVFIVIRWHLCSLLGVFIVLEAAMPSAATLPIVAQLHDADSAFISQGVFITHLVAIITVPFWLGVLFMIGCMV